VPSIARGSGVGATSYIAVTETFASGITTGYGSRAIRIRRGADTFRSVASSLPGIVVSLPATRTFRAGARVPIGLTKSGSGVVYLNLVAMTTDGDAWTDVRGKDEIVAEAPGTYLLIAELWRNGRLVASDEEGFVVR
jgi:hypothetical protein